MDRKEFIKSTCNTCLLGTAAIFLPILSGCGPATQVFKTTVSDNNQLAVPLNLFDKNAIQLVRPKGWQYDIAVQKKKDNKYSALLLRCTHQDNQLDKTGNGYHCSLHGSQFDGDGKVMKGPAELSLKQYNTSLTENNLIIYL
jgi:Rieske Fe-S protein